MVSGFHQSAQTRRFSLEIFSLANVARPNSYIQHGETADCITSSALPQPLFLENGIALQDRISIYQMSVNAVVGVMPAAARKEGDGIYFRDKDCAGGGKCIEQKCQFTGMFWVQVTYCRFSFSYY